MSKQVFPYFNATLGTSDEGLRTFYYCWRRTFTITALLRNIQYCNNYIDSDV